MWNLWIRHLIISIVLPGALTGALQQRDTIRARVDVVVVPASVRDSAGKFVYDLKQDEFVILEDGRRQEIRTLSSDPLPLSVAVLIDTGLGKAALKRVANSIVSLTSAFTETDEVEIYRFDHVFSKLSTFTNTKEEMEKKLEILKLMADKRYNDPSPMIIMPGRGPRWLRVLLDQGIPEKSLNDPLFAAASDLATREAERRKVILVISDGQVAGGSDLHPFAETRDRLVRDQIQVYAIAAGNALFTGKTSILRTFAEATGGDVYGGRTQNAMENAMARSIEQARHQYVLTYMSSNEVFGALAVSRNIQVNVTRPGVTVLHRKTYLQYPSPK